MLLENIVWVAIGFLPMYGAMELSWRLARRIAIKRNKTRGKGEETIVASRRSKVG
jgi:hypothetical protein